MARGKGRGGYQRPSKPAATSGPGASSQRTDGGPSLEYSGLPYGENSAVNDQMAAAPMPGGGGGPAPQGGGGRSPMGPNGVFGPSDRPGEPLTAGVDAGAGAGAPPQDLPDDPNLLLRAIVSQVGYHPDLVRLLTRG